MTAKKPSGNSGGAMQPNGSFQNAPLSAFLLDLSQIAGSSGMLAAGYILAGALLEGIGISLLIPLLGILFSGAAVPHWLGTGASAAFALFDAQSRLSHLLVLLGMFAFLVALRAGAVSARDFAIFRLQLDFVQTQQMRTANALAGAPWSRLAALRHARVSQIMSGDIQRLGVGIHFALRGAVAALILGVQYGLALLLAPALAAIAAGLLLVCAVSVGPMVARSRSIGDFVAEANLSLLDTTAQFMGGLKLAISQNLQPGFIDQVQRLLRSSAARQLRFARQQALGQSGLLALFGVTGVAAVCGGLFWFEISPPVLIAFLLILTRMVAPLEQMQQAAQQFPHLLSVYGKMRSVQSELAQVIDDDATKTGDDSADGDIIFENVSYRHAFPGEGGGREEARGGVRNLNLTIAKGEFLGITGPSGIGKTTLADLLAGLFAPQAGRILVDGQPLDGVTVARWRGVLAYIPQDPFLFHDSIRRNLLWANPDADEPAMWRALAVAGADDLVRTIERGLDSVVGERGSLLSGGERQRIALARALLRSPRLLILDEATNALDSESERSIFECLSGLEPRPTIVAIAQRTENLGVCDRVIELAGTETTTAISEAVSFAESPAPQSTVPL